MLADYLHCERDIAGLDVHLNDIERKNNYYVLFIGILSRKRRSFNSP